MDAKTEKPEAEREEKKKKRGLLWLFILLLLLLVGALVCVIARMARAGEGDYTREVRAKLGQLEGKTEAEIQAELNRVIGEGMFHIVINGDPVFEDGAAEGNLEIENVPNNRYLMRVEITLDDTGEVVYSTDYIDPNMHVQRAPLQAELDAGDYPATAVFYAYDMDTLVPMGSAASKITIHVTR